jgi:hypothetical protein
MSRNSGHRTRVSFWRKLLSQLSRYDLQLLAIPLAFSVSLLGALVFAVSLSYSFVGGAVLSLPLMVDALFFNPPTSPGSEQ